jgi:hypothetical protein
MANIFLNADQTGYTLSNVGDFVYGHQGNESVLIKTTAVLLDQNIEQVILDGSVSDFTFQQQGNRLLVYTGTDLMVTIPVQADENGTLLSFDDGVYNAAFEGATIELGGTAVPSDNPGAVVPVDGLSGFLSIDIDTGTLETPAFFDAGNGAYDFEDDATVAGNVVINNFSSDDIISFSNADPEDCFFENDGTDVILSYHHEVNDEKIMSIIQLTGVVSSEDKVFDQTSFVSAIGFDPLVS